VHLNSESPVLRNCGLGQDAISEKHNGSNSRADRFRDNYEFVAQCYPW
jgi:hypothetical protein